MKKFKRFTLSILVAIMSLVGGNFSVFASEKVPETIVVEGEINENVPYNGNEILVLDETTGEYEVKLKDNFISPRLTTYHASYLHFNQAQNFPVTCYVYKNDATNTITSTGIAYDYNHSYYTARYNVTFNSIKSVAYFTVTVYTKSIFGGIDRAVQTLYATVS